MRVDGVNIVDLSNTSVGVDKAQAEETKNKDSEVFRIEKSEKPGAYGDATYQKPKSQGEDIVSDIQNQAGMTTAAQMKNEMVVASNTTSAEDAKKVEDDGFSIYDTQIETVVTETDKMKLALAKAGVDTSYFGDDLSEDQLKKLGASPELIGQITAAYAQADLPATTDNVADSAEGLAMADELSTMSDGAVKYMLDNQLAPSIENIYKAQFSGSASYSATQSDTDYTSMLPQIEQVITEAGMTVNEDSIADSKWLLDNGIPLTPDNLTYMNELQELTFPQSTEDVLAAQTQAVAEGNRPQQGMLIEGYSLADQAQHAVEVIESASDEELSYLVTNNMEVTIENLEQAKKQMSAGTQTGAASQSAIDLITARRQLEEVRLAMTAEANYALLKQGISIDTKPLAELVDALRAQENSYYEQLLTQAGVKADSTQVDTFRTTIETVDALKDMPAYTIGIPEADTDTLAGLAEAGKELQDTFTKAGESYETMMTAPRADLGDSIQKAFRNVDDILQDLGLEKSASNERAVRILAYNQIEITEDSIMEVKAADEQVQRAFKNLTPSVVRELIAEQQNPLDMDISELNQKATEIRADLGTEEEVKFSKYLYQLEQNQEISADERSAYIGIYRLIHQVEKTDGAAVGSLLQQGADVTMRNLLTQVRSSRHNNREYAVDDNFDGVSARAASTQSITDQIDQGYISSRISDIADEMTPGKIQQIMADENWQELTPEQLAEQLAELDEEQVDDGYARQMQQDLSQSAQASEEVYQMLAQYDVPITVGNLLAAQQMLENRNGAFKQFFDTTGTGQEQSEAADTDLAALKEQILHEFGEAVKTPAAMADAQQKLAETAENVMRNMIVSEEDVTALDLRAMKLMTTQFTIGSELAKEENYSIPVLVQGEMTNISLKIVRGSENKGMVDLMFESAGLGKVAAHFSADGDGVSGVVTTDSKEAAAYLEEHSAALEEALQGTPTEADGAQKVQITYLTSSRLNLNEYGRQENGKPAAQEADSTIQTKTLYYMAESFISAVKGLE